MAKDTFQICMNGKYIENKIDFNAAVAAVH